jgi:hypothetical protein
MSEPAKDKAELVEQVRQAIWRHSDGREDAEAAIAALFWIRHGNLYRHPRHAALVGAGDGRACQHQPLGDCGMSKPAKDEAKIIALIADVLSSNSLGFTHHGQAVRALAAIRAAGWAVVPVEPTEDMRRAVWRDQITYVNGSLPNPASAEQVHQLVQSRMDDPRQQLLDRIAYAAMLAAAPGVEP